MRPIALVLLVSVPLLGACGGGEKKQDSTPSTAPAPAPSATELPGAAGTPAAGGAEQQALPPGHPPLGDASGGTGTPQIVPPDPGTGSGETGMAWTAPADWEAQVPKSAMRKAQYRVPGPGGDGECVVFYFGPNQGGNPDDNVKRWGDQFGATPRTRELQAPAGPITIVETEGTFDSGVGMGGDGQAKPNYALLGAIAKGPDANWFFKFTGPEATVKAQRAAFEQMLRTLRHGA